MKYITAIVSIALSLGTVSLLPKSALASDIYSQYNSIDNSSVIVAQQRREQHRNDREHRDYTGYRERRNHRDHRDHKDNRDYRYHRNDRHIHRFWVPGHWERQFNGHRRWVPGHWVYRR
jgi:hypothetical protein